jgi:Sulfotransferase domain
LSATQSLEAVSKRLPPPLARGAKRVAVYPRYFHQRRACRRGFRKFGVLYPQKVLFVAGLPKSGTTWLERMLSSYPGFHDILIPAVTSHEYVSGGSHKYDLPSEIFSRFENMLVVTKMHVHGSPHNVRVLRAAGVKYVVLYRDLRDVAVSHVFYVRQTPWHPEHPLYAGLSVEAGLDLFADRTLVSFVDWIRSWNENADPDMSLHLRYETMLSDTPAVMRCVAEHFELNGSEETISSIVRAHAFHQLSGGRAPGQTNTKSFFRKGLSGDWRTYFTPALKETYKRRVGSFLIEVGYERDLSW